MNVKIIYGETCISEEKLDMIAMAVYRTMRGGSS